MSNQITFDELEVLRIQVASLIQRVGELEADKSRLHAMLQSLAQQHVARNDEDPPQSDG